eukprot:jgi/Orpsp1_1/1187911/evm.model.d7180000061071.1
MAEEFSTVSDTLFIPMKGRIYSTENFPMVLKDEKALSLKDKLPPPKENENQTQYMLMASAIRSRNMDRYIKDFIERNPEGIIIEIGCGLETTYDRCDNGKTRWYAMDLPEVINYRKTLLPPGERQKLIPGDILKTDWIDTIKNDINQNNKSDQPIPVLVSAGGLYHYFEKKDVLQSIRNLRRFDKVELVFDTLNHLGIKGIKRYMKKAGRENAIVYFYVDDGNELIKDINEENIELLKEEKYYCEAPKDGLDFITKASMRTSDLFNMVKMIHLKLK